MAKQRYVALDAMRGLTLALMVLVNTPGSWSYVYAPLLHADWHGATFTDYIFPFFLFIVGSAMFFSNRSQASIPYSVRTVKIIKRTALMFLIGLLLNFYPFSGSVDELRILGVLQRIALAYCAAAFIVWLPGVARLMISATLLLGYWGLMNLVDDPYGLTGNIVRQIDLAVLGADHLWQGKGLAFDPEGVLSTFPAIVNVIFGFEAARMLIASENKAKAQIKLVIVAVASIAVALTWHQVFPINKSLWTSSFVLLTSGAAILVLLALVQLEKLSLARSLEVGFAQLGKNPLFIYILSIVWVKSYYLFSVDGQSLYQFIFQAFNSFLNEYNASLAFALIHVAILWLVAWWMDKKKIVISI
ncbi:heparan-alpha-glucosaminide N-acetyltransferase domain-containing protein [Gilvimarinus sp. SDUM040013]|uniref:Heparan-alpha-glucosaminide N-acetyltransferase domain-containing protein n=1 Tax=Gilvimarinus gilvus TaxID=3058038 RepID=A0ABU4RY85_9GAMM|nr:heparan-alpha-glucosaminide N-acetyltransferase domain-containing protein [Gilvimarinus sp. SDUM040013]MDO3385218.1 heparan-alpha-glucosaminide N-acetyltransferase domain-containing protein [Gilvimarinus sp. SDUM040013]MDX6849201.1 heparan-alpha-glucosaminide N-acetyltransferase domain-containing protein [Gilvimarinus sp. SDUM040013]